MSAKRGEHPQSTASRASCCKSKPKLDRAPEFNFPVHIYTAVRKRTWEKRGVFEKSRRGSYSSHIGVDLCTGTGKEAFNTRHLVHTIKGGADCSVSSAQR